MFVRLVSEWRAPGREKTVGAEEFAGDLVPPTTVIW